MRRGRTIRAIVACVTAAIHLRAGDSLLS